MRTGLVLEGGGMRGIYTAGVLDIFMENDILFDGVIGVSAGAIHGSSYVAAQKGRSIRYYKKYCNDKRFMSFRNFFRTGDIVGEEFCYHELPEKLDLYDYDAFSRGGMEFYVTCSNVETGKAEYLRIQDMRTEIDLMRASASMPYVSRIVDYRGKKYLDGGCCDSIPVRAFQKMGFEKNVVVLTRDDSYRKKPENARLAHLFYKKYPAFAKALMKRHSKYNRTVEGIRQMEKAGKIFVIRPSVPLEIGRVEHNPKEIQKTYDIGRRDARNKLAEMKEWLCEE